MVIMKTTCQPVPYCNSMMGSGSNVAMIEPIVGMKFKMIVRNPNNTAMSTLKAINRIATITPDKIDVKSLIDTYVVTFTKIFLRIGFSRSVFFSPRMKNATKVKIRKKFQMTLKTLPVNALTYDEYDMVFIFSSSMSVLKFSETKGILSKVALSRIMTWFL